MTARFLTILTGRNLPKIRQPREPEPSTINEKTIADFTHAVERTGILEQEPGNLNDRDALAIDHRLELFPDTDIQLDNPLIGLMLAPVPASNGEHTVSLGLIENRKQPGLEIDRPSPD
jgi:hypothetical protein